MATSDAPGPVWAVWTRLLALFPLWKLPMEGFGTPGGRGYFTADFCTGLRRNRSTAEALALVAPLDEAAFEKLSCIAQLNLRRHEVAFRFTALVYLALPLSGGITFNQVAPDMMESTVQRATPLLLATLAVFTAWVLFHLAGVWRARQVAAVLDIARIEQDRALPSPKEGAGIGSGGNGSD